MQSLSSKTEEEIKALREVVERLETATVKGFEDTVKSVERAGDGVIDLTEKSKGFSELQLELQQKMVENLVKLNAGQQPKSPPSEEGFHIRKRANQRSETLGSDSDASMRDKERNDLEKTIADLVKSQAKEKEKVQPTHLPDWKSTVDTNCANHSSTSKNQGVQGGHPLPKPAQNIICRRASTVATKELTKRRADRRRPAVPRWQDPETKKTAQLQGRKNWGKYGEKEEHYLKLDRVRLRNYR
ncbi:hypothetical protein CYMTET_9212 [Cymbomonas tetramitiformis]|uniref:Uncharacterized protein n=1 Tax=Cymbomonas tetramitiformis TaxID=36881 RepID=A0AAE0GRX9_9CHLO|nr:hypothetical protein CYMTET_9212 [Cymbomonas tetramitiformis]